MRTSDLPRTRYTESCDHPTTKMECPTAASYQVEMKDGTTYRLCASHRLDLLIVSGNIGADTGQWTR